MRPSFLPKPLLYKEWKEHRWWLLVAFVLLVYGPVFSLLALGTAAQTAGAADTTSVLLWKTLVPILYHVQYTPGNAGTYPMWNGVLIHGQPAVSTSAVLISMGLMISLITVERNRRTLWFTLSFPIRRIDAVRVKIFLALSVVVSGLFLDFLVLLGCDLAAHNAIPAVILRQWLGQNLLISMTLMSIGLVCAAVIQSGFLAGMTAIILAAIPWGLGVSILRSLPTNTGLQIIPIPTYQTPLANFSAPSSGATTLAGHISRFLRSLSPNSYFSGTSGFGAPFNDQSVSLYIHWGHHLSIGLILWFIGIIVVGGIVGVYAYLRAPIENSSYWGLFPWLVPFLLAVYYGALSFLAVNAFTVNSSNVKNTPYLMTGYWFGTWIVAGLLFIGIQRASKRRIYLRTGK